MADPFIDHRDAAREVLRSVLANGETIRPKEGGFLGQMAFDANPMTEKQARWLGALLDRHGLPPMEDAL